MSPLRYHLKLFVVFFFLKEASLNLFFAACVSIAPELLPANRRSPEIILSVFEEIILYTSGISPSHLSYRFLFPWRNWWEIMILWRSRIQSFSLFLLKWSKTCGVLFLSDFNKNPIFYFFLTLGQPTHPLLFDNQIVYISLQTAHIPP